MKTIEELSQQVNDLYAKLRKQGTELQSLRQAQEHQSEETSKALAESMRAKEFAMKSYRVDHDGWIWRWDFDKKVYIKTTNRVNTPVIPCGAIGTRNLINGCVTKDKLDAVVKNLLGSTSDKSIGIRHLSDELLSWLTEQFSGSTVVFMTQAEYDALRVKDDDVVYMIYEEDGEEPTPGHTPDTPDNPVQQVWRFGDTMPVILT